MASYGHLIKPRKKATAGLTGRKLSALSGFLGLKLLKAILPPNPTQSHKDILRNFKWENKKGKGN